MLETRSHRTTVRDKFALQTGEAQLVPFMDLLHNPHLQPHVYPKGRQAYSLLQTTMEPLSHGLLVLFQQAIDRQDRTTD